MVLGHDVRFPLNSQYFGPIEGSFAYELTGFGVMESHFAYELISFGAVECHFAFEFIGFGTMKGICL